MRESGAQWILLLLLSVGCSACSGKGDPSESDTDTDSGAEEVPLADDEVGFKLYVDFAYDPDDGVDDYVSGTLRSVTSLDGYEQDAAVGLSFGSGKFWRTNRGGEFCYVVYEFPDGVPVRDERHETGALFSVRLDAAGARMDSTCYEVFGREYEQKIAEISGEVLMELRIYAAVGEHGRQGVDERYTPMDSVVGLGGASTVDGVTRPHVADLGWAELYAVDEDFAVLTGPEDSVTASEWLAAPALGPVALYGESTTVYRLDL